MALSREQILKKRKLPTEKVPCPEWADEGTPEADAYVVVRTMPGTKRDQWEASLAKGKGKGSDPQVSLENIRAKLAIATCVDDAGNQIFTEEDIKELGETSCVPLGRIFDVAMRLNGIGKQHVEELVGES